MLPRNRVVGFGPFTFSRARGLRRGDHAVPLRHLERQLLKCLLDRPGEIVRKEELIAALWPNVQVAPNTLNVHVRRLRIALGDGRRRLLKLVPRMGYMLVVVKGRHQRSVELSAAAVRPRDQSRFISDVTVPDGSIMEPGERFEKVWEVQNSGQVGWSRRVLRRVGACSGIGRIASAQSIPVPKTEPNQTVLIRADLIAPQDPGSYYAMWKMVDENGNECFPRQRGLFVSIDVLI